MTATLTVSQVSVAVVAPETLTCSAARYSWRAVVLIEGFLVRVQMGEPNTRGRRDTPKIKVSHEAHKPPTLRLVGRPRLPIGTAGEPTVTKQPDGSWRARCYFRDWDGQRRTVTRQGQSREKARRALLTAVKDRGGRRGTITPDTTLDVLAETWLAEVTDDDKLAAGSRQTYRHVIDKHVKPRLGAARVGEVDAHVIDQALRKLAADSPSVAKTMRTVLSGMFGLAVRARALPANPVKEARPVSRKPKRPPRALTVAEVEDLTDQLRSDARAVDLDLPDLVDWMLGTGARIGEALAARRATVDRGRGLWEVDATVVRIKAQGLVLQPPKTQASHRVLVLPGYLRDMLDRRDTEVRVRTPEGLIFPSPARRTLRDPSNCAGDLRDTLKRLGWEGVTFHTFRKTVATRFDEAGRTAREAANQLGHSKVSLVQDVYFGRRVAVNDAATILNR